MSTEKYSDGDSMVFVYRNHSYCDWRVTLSCEDGHLYKLLYIINLVVAFLITVACIILLWYRIRRQRCTIFSPKISGTGFIRPNPVEGFLVWTILWLIGRMVYIIILWSDVFHNKYFILETLQESYWTFGVTGYAWFVIGTYSQIGSHLNSKQRPWRPNSKLSDTYLLLVTVIAPLSILPITATSGYFRDHNNIKISNTLITVKYTLWGLWSGFGAIGTFYFGRELCNILSYHISIAKVGRVKKMQSGLEKIKFTLYVILSTYLYFTIYFSVISIFREWTITHSKILNIFMFVTYAFFNPFCIMFVVATISVRIIQGHNRDSSSSMKKLITSNDINSSNNDNNNNSFHRNQSINTRMSIPYNNSRKNTDGFTSETNPSIAFTDQNQSDELYPSRYNTNNISNFVDVKVHNVDEIEISESGPSSNYHNVFKQPEQVVRLTPPIYNQKYI